DIGRAAHAAGFWFTWDAAREQFDHPAMLVAIRDGRIVQVGRGPPHVFGGISRIETEDDASDVGGRAKPCIGGVERAQVRRADPRASREHDGEEQWPLAPEARQSALAPRRSNDNVRTRPVDVRRLVRRPYLQYRPC